MPIAPDAILGRDRLDHEWFARSAEARFATLLFDLPAEGESAARIRHTCIVGPDRGDAGKSRRGSDRAGRFTKGAGGSRFFRPTDASRVGHVAQPRPPRRGPPNSSSAMILVVISS
jgi:hypothetical protein